MNVASLELCKELYELSGWKPSAVESEMNWRVTADGDQQLWARLNPEDWDQVISIYHAYDLGYLLRKLPHRTQKNGQFNLSPYLDYKPHPFPNLPTTMVMWQAQYGPEAHRQLGDTPEDAACRLAIELFKQGVLTRGDA